MQKRTVIFTYISEKDLKIGDLIGILCQNDANDILTNGSIIDLNELKEPDKKEPSLKSDADQVKDNKVSHNDLSKEDRELIFTEVSDKVTNIKDIPPTQLLHYGCEGKHEVKYMQYNKLSIYDLFYDYVCYEPDLNTLIALYHDSQKHYCKFLETVRDIETRPHKCNYKFRIKFIKDNTFFGSIEYNEPKFFKEFILKNIDIIGKDVDKVINKITLEKSFKTSLE